MVNVDHLHVGWYQSAHFGNFLSPQLLESHFAYQTSIDESVCLIFGKNPNLMPQTMLRSWGLINGALIDLRLHWVWGLIYT